MKTTHMYLKKRSLPIIMGILWFILGINAKAKHQISVVNTEFVPSSLTIQKGDTVTWSNTQGYHSIEGSQSSYPSNPESFGIAAGMNWVYTYVFDKPGTYDYHCEPHLSLGMTGQIIVEEKPAITINFSEMTPHTGQNMWLAVIEKGTDEEIFRIKKTIEESFSIEVETVEIGNSYAIDFFADFNENGQYEAPPSDHAWHMEVDNLEGDSIVNFMHNTNFTDIEWQYRLTINFTDMNPHIDQNMVLSIFDKEGFQKVDQSERDIEANFSVDFIGIEADHNYQIDFYADFNENGLYDAPPTDHAWRLNLDNVKGDTTITFVHNTDFTDISRISNLTFKFMEMTPHLNQRLEFYVFDKIAKKYVDTIILSSIENADFEINSNNLETGSSYNLDFYADFNDNGKYDAPPTDHSWRITLDLVKGDTTINFSHNIDFTKIFETEDPNPTKIENNYLSSGFKPFPIPATDFIKINFESQQSQYIEIKIMDINGLVIKNYNIHGTGNTILDISDLRKGWYLIKTTTNSNIQVHKILKN